MKLTRLQNGKYANQYIFSASSVHHFQQPNFNNNASCMYFSRGTEHFRHDYSKLVSLKAIANDAPVLLCTATMTCDMFTTTCETLYMRPSDFKIVFQLPDRFVKFNLLI